MANGTGDGNLIQRNPWTAVAATLLASGGLSGVGVDQFLGGATAREEAAAHIQVVVDAAERSVQAAYNERDRVLADIERARDLYLECNRARLGGGPD